MKKEGGADARPDDDQIVPLVIGEQLRSRCQSAARISAIHLAGIRSKSSNARINRSERNETRRK